MEVGAAMGRVFGVVVVVVLVGVNSLLFLGVFGFEFWRFA